MRIALLMATTILFFTAPVFAADEPPAKPQFPSFINGISCGQLIEGLAQEQTRKAYILTVGSFISGANYAKNRDSQTALKGMLQLTEQFCRQNPELPILTAMIFLDKSIDKRISVEK